jgi:hypothetical protein
VDAVVVVVVVTRERMGAEKGPGLLEQGNVSEWDLGEQTPLLDLERAEEAERRDGTVTR